MSRKKEKKRQCNVPDSPRDDEGDTGESKITEDKDEELVRVLEEEKEMDEGDEMGDKENKRLVRDVEMIEEVMGEEIRGLSKLVKPVC